ncbi:MAG: phosphoribosyltransferase [Gammaproteobacteria bacterium]
MSEKLYISAQELLEDSWALAAKIIEDGFKPDYIIAIWRGGAPIGISVQEMLAYWGINADHIAIRTSSYSGIDERSDEVRVHGLNYLIKNVNAEDSLLIVDDVFDTGLTIQAVIAELRRKARSNTPHDIRVAVPWYKPAHNRTDREPEYYVHTTERWLKFPHSLEGLTPAEIKTRRPELYEIIEPVLPAPVLPAPVLPADG